MKIKYLSLCLLSLSLAACSQHVVKPNTSNAGQLDQRAVNGLNAMFETSSFDIRGKLAIQANPQVKKSAEKDTNKAKNSATEQDDVLQKQIEKTLKAQNIKLTQKEKNELLKAVAEYTYDDYGDYEESDERKSAKRGLSNFLNDLEISYDGSVHYRQKLASLNLNMQYQKPTLLVKAQVPMVVDFKQYKFYTNYFALMPYLVNRESQDVFAYLDFSHYKSDLSKFNIQNFVEYLKQSNALPYAVAKPNQISTVALNAQEKNLGISEKIRLSTDVETLLLQARLFAWVNKPYFSEKILGEPYVKNSPAEDAAAAADEAAAAAELAVAEAVGEYINEDDYSDADRAGIHAYYSAERVHEVISNEFRRLVGDEYEDDSDEYHDDTDAAYEYAEAVECTDDEVCVVAASEVEAEEIYADDADDAEHAMSERACEALIHSKTKVALGAVNYCAEYYDIDLLAKNQHEVDATEGDEYAEDGSAYTRLETLFEQYQSTNFTDAKAFAALWNKHLVEINRELERDTQKRSQAYVDVSLDQQGRAYDLSYDISKADTAFGDLRVLSQTQFLNYNNATAIDKKKLQNAKTLSEVAKGSILESLVSRFTESLGANDVIGSLQDQEPDEDGLSITERLDKLALETYQRTGSYVKAYQAVFVIVYAIQNPEKVKYYSASELNEIAELHAYYYSDLIPEPNASTQKRLDRLAEQHMLKSPSQFDGTGSTVASIVDEAINAQQEINYWKSLMKSSKSKQAAFAQHYQKLFLEDYSIDANEKATLVVVSKLLAQAYADDVKDKLSKQSIKGLKVEYDDFIDYDVYRQTYADVERYADQ